MYVNKSPKLEFIVHSICDYGVTTSNRGAYKPLFRVAGPRFRIGERKRSRKVSECWEAPAVLNGEFGDAEKGLLFV